MNHRTRSVYPDAAALLLVFQDLKCSRFCWDAVVNALFRI